MSSIPEEIYHEIILRLPVKSLLVCKSVCKNWYALITSSDFVKLHLTFQKNNSGLLLLRCNNSISFVNAITRGNLIYSVSYDSLPSLSSSLTREFDDVAVETDYPMQSTCSITRLVGSCNGLVCLKLHGSDEEEFICLWNPATKEYRKIPKSPNENEDTGRLDLVPEIYAFSYACKIDDYKLVKLVRSYGCRDSFLSVYSLGSDSWGTVQSIPYRIRTCCGVPGVLVNGALHWLSETRHNYEAIFALELSDTRFQEIQLPKEPLEKISLVKSVGVLEGCLCVLFAIKEPVAVVFEIWVMQDYGIQESWNKHHIIKNERIMYDYSYFGFMGCFKTGELLLMAGYNLGELLLCDPKLGCCRVIIQISKLFDDADNYAESLVSLNSGTYMGRTA